MKYVLARGIYRMFRGYEFIAGRPVDITDRGTLELIARDHDFKEVKDEPQKVQAPATPVLAPESKRKTLRLPSKGMI